MEAKWRWILLTAIAPVCWGATYYVTRHFLPADAPVWGSALRALPAGILLLAIARRRPRGAWWWRTAILGLLNVGAFFLLVYLSAQLLPTSVAASVMALAPVALAGFAWLLVGERPRVTLAAGAVVAIAGTLLLVWRGTGEVTATGLAAATAALLLSSLGAILGRRWADDTPILATTAWQLLAGGAALTAAAALVEGPPPALAAPQLAALAFVSLLATGVAFVCWFGGIARLPAGLVGTVGLLNPLTGTALGATLGGEALGAPQLGGIALILAGILVAQRRRPAVRPAGGGAQDTPPVRFPQIRSDIQPDPRPHRHNGAMTAPRILVVDDEPNIRDLLSQSLRFAGFQVKTVGNGAATISAVLEEEPDLIVLDVMLPDMNGFSVTTRLRDHGFTAPILFLTAKDETEDKIKGLNAGGDDYVTKPFSLDEIVARIQAILRRTMQDTEDEQVIRAGELTMDQDTHDVYVGDAQIDLSPTEFKLLRYLMLNPNRVLSKAQILDHVWEYDFNGDAGIVESYISYLRRKIDPHATESLIQTKRGFGYMLKVDRAG